MLNSDVGEGKVLSQQDLDPFDFRQESKEDGDVNLPCFFTNEM
jgi:hypothetical protein